MEEKIEALIGKTIEELGYELYDVIYEKEAQDYYLRIFIDTPKGISLDDCEKVNDAINPIIDEANYIKDQYFLEVSSTGVEKIIRKEKHLNENIDEYITVNLFKPVNNSKEFVGILKKFDNETIYLDVNDEVVELERKNISLIKKYFDWDNELN